MADASNLKLTIDEHPTLDLFAFVTNFPLPLGELTVPVDWKSRMSGEIEAPFSSDDRIRAAVRDLLRHGGFKPTGRSKPASEYLLKAVADGQLAPINVAVDACNIVSLHSGLPISVVDIDRLQEPLRVSIAPAGSSYVFNAAGQVIDVAGLLCLLDQQGPCANAVKDAQRTKTHAGTRQTLSLIWGTRVLGGRSAAVGQWYRELLGEVPGVVTQPIC